MHKLSTAAPAIGLSLLLAGCGTLGPQPQDPRVSSAKGLKLVFEQVCMPVILDGADFTTSARARMMVETPPTPDETGQSSQAFRLGDTGVIATLWEDGSCMVGAVLGDSEQLRAQTLASLSARGHAMAPGIANRPVPYDGVLTAYCNPDSRPLVVAVTIPASVSAKRPAMVATLFRARDVAADTCLRPMKS